MIELFNNFTHVDTTMMPTGGPPKYPNMCKPAPNYEVSRPNKPYESYNPQGELKGYFWYYGNSVDLVFDITGTLTLTQGLYMEAAEVLPHLLSIFTIYDHRHTCVLQYSNSNIGEPLEYKLEYDEVGNAVKGIIAINISHEQSMKLPKGTYTCSLTVSHPSGYHETLFNTGTCTFEVR